jgi:cilia- and flagella-associated protein 65
MIKNDIVKCEEGELKYRDESQQEKAEILDIPNDDSLTSSEYFFDNMGSQRPAVLVDSYIDFGSCSRYRVIDSMVIRVANNTKAKLTCAWISPGEASGEEPVFMVTPKVGDVPAKGMAEFRVQFRPTMDNAFYGQQLECYVFFKSMRSFRLVNDITFTPPFCLLATVAG